MNRRSIILAVFILSIACVSITAQSKDAPLSKERRRVTQLDPSKSPSPTPTPDRPDSVANHGSVKTQTAEPEQKAAGGPTPSVENSLKPIDAKENTTGVTGQNENEPKEQVVSIRSIPAIDTKRDWVDRTTLVIAFILTVLAIVQIVLLKQTVRDTGISARAAQDAVEEAKRSSRLDQRAWVAIKSLLMVTLEVGKPLVCRVILTNTGKTISPDTLAQVSVVARYTTLDIDKLSESLDWSKVENASRTVLFPNSEFILDGMTTSNVSREDIAGIQAGKIMVYFFGKIHYADIFSEPNTRPHTTEFCGVYSPSKNAFNVCPGHNRSN